MACWGGRAREHGMTEEPLDVLIAGGHGRIARALGRRLDEQGVRVRGIIRDPSQRDDLATIGMESLVLDLEEVDAGVVARAASDATAIVFAAGAGPGSGPERKETVDYGAAVKLIAAAHEAGIERYVMISSMGADDPPDGDDVFHVYLRAKARADSALMDSGLRWTIVRPGRLTDQEPTGRVTLARSVERGEVPRADVAHVLAACLRDDRTVGHVLEVVGGETPIEEAIERVVG